MITYQPRHPADTLPAFRIPEQPPQFWRVFNRAGRFVCVVRAASRRDAVRIGRQEHSSVFRAVKMTAAEYVAEFNAAAGAWS